MSEIRAVVLAAGRGKRLGGDIAKVMREVNGRALLDYVTDALGFIAREDIIIVAGYQKERVFAAFEGYSFAVQDEQLGTGHAVLSANDALRDYHGAVLVCCGDMPLLRRETFESLVATHFTEGNTCTMLTGTTEHGASFGRIVRGANGEFLRIVEARDCTDEQLAIREVNSGVYVFDCDALLSALRGLRNENEQGEYYLTDAPEIIGANGGKIGLCVRELGDEVLGVNTSNDLERVEKILSV